MPRSRSGSRSGSGGGSSSGSKASGNNKNVKMQSVVQVHPHHGMTAQRFAGKPLRQPKYAFRDVPKCRRDLAGSRLYEVSRRDDFNDSMAEMVLLCNEVMKRQADVQAARALEEGKTEPVKRTAKPLSLEYIADRMDVDDPISGFFVRTGPPLLETAAVASAAALDDEAEAQARRMQPAQAHAQAQGVSTPIAAASSSLSSSRRRNPSPRAAAAAASAPSAAAVSSAISAAAGATVSGPTSGNANTSTNAIVTTNSKVKEGMLQGFITVTTFTNWQKSFRWDSLHESAFAYDDPRLAEAMSDGTRKYDRDGRLAEAMQSTVRCGDAWNEGIVWPRIAEISLLGALGCGKSLVQLAVERLERTPPSAKRNYEYVVLQATTNSVPFYESLGFVRVGCVTDNENFTPPPEDGAAGNASGGESDGEEKKEGDVHDEGSTVGPGRRGSRRRTNGADNLDSKPSAAPSDTTNPAATGTAAAPVAAAEGDIPAPEISSSPVETYTTTKDGEKVGEIAKNLGVDVWDVIFLNHFTFPSMAPSSKVMKGTELFVPSKKAKVDACSDALRNNAEFGGASDATQWYYCADDETPKDIAEKFNVDCKDLVKRNRDRLQGLQPYSNLMEGTKVQVSHFDRHMDTRVPYCHWTFPDDTIETSEPSYMMALKLNRKTRAEAKFRPVEYSFAVPVSKYDNAVLQYADTSSVASSVTAASEPPAKAKATKKRKRMEKHPDEPDKPKRPLSAYFHFVNQMREIIKQDLNTTDVKEITREAAQRWNEATEKDRAKYHSLAEQGRVAYEAAMKKYEAEMDRFRRANPEWIAEQERIAAENAEIDEASSAASGSTKGYRNLFSKVVTLTEEGQRESGSEFKYFYVLTYIPDLQWCHLAPMRAVGKWGPEKPKAQGRPKWMLVPEQEGKEVDISAASVGDVVRSRALRNNQDADKEQWDIPESGPPVPGEEGKRSYKVRDTFISIGGGGSSVDAASSVAPSSRRSSLGSSIASAPAGGSQDSQANKVKRRNQICAIEGCNKFKQAGCEGMCIRHFRDPSASASPARRGRPRTVVDPKETAVSSAVSKGEARPPPKKKRKTSTKTRDTVNAVVPEVARKKKVKDPCKAPGCPKSRSGKCAGFCATHYKAFLSNNEGGRPAVASSLSSTPSPSSVASAVQPRWLKKTPGDQCKWEDCPKSRRGYCKGFCREHFEMTTGEKDPRTLASKTPPSSPKPAKKGSAAKSSSKKSSSTKSSLSPKKASASPRKKRPSDICIVDGCERWRSGGCEGMCRKHFSEAEAAKAGKKAPKKALGATGGTKKLTKTKQRVQLRALSLKAGAIVEDLDYAEKMGLPPGWSCRENKNANYLIYSPGREERFTSKAKAFAAAGVEMPPINRNQPTSASAKKKKRKREEEVEEVSEEESEEEEDEEEEEEDEEEEGDDPPWRPSGHKFIGQTVKVADDEGSEQFGAIVGWIADTDVDKDGNPGFVSEQTGKPACLFNVEFGDGTSQDFEEDELQGKFVPASEISAPVAKKPKGRSKGSRKSCAVPGCPKNARGPSHEQMCIAHYRQCQTLHCGPEDLAGSVASNAANGGVDHVETFSQVHTGNVSAIPFPDDFDSMAAAAAASAADGGLPHHEPADIIPRELEATAVEATEEDFHAILEALEPSRHATRSGRDFTSPLFGQL